MDKGQAQIICPLCGSNQISAQRKGYGLIKGLAGGVLLGPLGLAGGFLGSGVRVFCLACGHNWRPGEVRPKKPRANQEPKPSAVDRLNAWSERVNASTERRRAAIDKNSPMYKRQVKMAKTIWMIVGPILILVFLLVWLVPATPQPDGQQPEPAAQQLLDKPQVGR